MQSKVFLGGGWYVIMIASCGRGVEGVVPDDYNITWGGGALGTPDSDYEFYLPEYVGHCFAKMVIKTISIATNIDPGPILSVSLIARLMI